MVNGELEIDPTGSSRFLESGTVRRRNVKRSGGVRGYEWAAMPTIKTDEEKQSKHTRDSSSVVNEKNRGV